MKTIDIMHERADLYEMANLDRTLTGLDVVVFCSPKGNTKHACRVKVCNTPGKMNENDVFSISVKDLEVVNVHACRVSTQTLEAVKWWIHRNKFAILDYWKGKTNTLQFAQAIKPITESENV